MKIWLEIRQASDDLVCFDAEHQAGTNRTGTKRINLCVGPTVQTYLEMLNSDICIHESAQPLRQRLIDEALKRREEA